MTLTPERREGRVGHELVFEDGVTRRQRAVDDDVAGRRERSKNAGVDLRFDADNSRRFHGSVLLNQDVVTFPDSACKHSLKVFDVARVDVVAVADADVGEDEVRRSDGQRGAAFGLDDVKLSSRRRVSVEEKDDGAELEVPVGVDRQDDVADFEFGHQLPVSGLEHDAAVALEASARFGGMGRFWK